MKLSTKLNEIDKAIELLSFVTISEKSSTILIKNYHYLKQAAEILDNIEMLPGLSNLIKTSSLYNNAQKIVETNFDEGSKIKLVLFQSLESLYTLSRSLKSALQIPAESEEYEIFEKNEENCIFIKLPETKNLKELSDSINTFDKIFSQSILVANVEGKIELETVEPGSVWMKICLGSIAAVQLVGGLAWASAVVYKKYKEVEYIEKLIEKQDIEIQEKQLLVDSQKRILKIIIDAEAKNIYNTHYNKPQEEGVDNESFERLKNVLNMLFEQMIKGAEVTPALPESENVDNLFPDMSNIPMIESKIKKLDH